MNLKNKSLEKELEVEVKKDGVWQGVLNLIYNHWQGDHYANYEWAKRNLNDTAAFLLLMGEFNQQVCNGGHSQYIFNRYAATDDELEELDIHPLLISLYKELNIVSYLKEGSELLSILEGLINVYEVHDDQDTECGYCDGTGTQYEENDAGDEDEVDCEYCYGSGEDSDINVGEMTDSCYSNLGALDKRYFSICDNVEKALSEYAENWYTDISIDFLYPTDSDTIIESVKKIKPVVKLIGMNGNALNLIGLAQRALRKAEMPDEAKEMAKEAVSGDYNHVLQTIMDYCEVE